MGASTPTSEYQNRECEPDSPPMFGEGQEPIHRDRPDGREHSTEYHITTLYSEKIANRETNHGPCEPGVASVHVGVHSSTRCNDSVLIDGNSGNE
jgi:hypothetical protein